MKQAKRYHRPTLKMLLGVTTLLFCFQQDLIAQETTTDSIPFTSIPDAPENYTPGTMVSRMVDGLGFRYRWATEGLSENDWSYAPGNDGRTIGETMDHVYNLSNVILNSAKKQPTDFTVQKAELSIAEKRMATLKNLETASSLFKASTDLSAHKIIFIQSNGRFEFPFWNNLNGPIEDAVWHTGQIVVLRRVAGNPINPKVNVLAGKLND